MFTQHLFLTLIFGNLNESSKKKKSRGWIVIWKKWRFLKVCIERYHWLDTVFFSRPQNVERMREKRKKRPIQIKSKHQKKPNSTKKKTVFSTHIPVHSHSRFFICGRYATFGETCVCVIQLKSIQKPPQKSIPHRLIYCEKKTSTEQYKVCSSFSSSGSSLSSVFCLFIVALFVCRNKGN